jgi:hypothetical protein
MPYITREDGERFVIPSYRDVITVKSENALKREILLLSSSYGEYITLQSKGPIQYEVAFSPDAGYLLGESVWNHFKRPLDMIYCEAIPNTTEALLVIVKDGGVYLDGSFPLESISEELIIFLTQQNNFKIFTYGDVPISETPEEGKFSFEPSSVIAFTRLDKPVFPTLPLLKMYQLQLVDQVLSAHGIGVFPIRKLIIGAVIIGVLWLMWTYMTTQREVVRKIVIQQINPYQAYNDIMISPAPVQEINQFLNGLKILFAMPGWSVNEIDYSHGMTTILITSNGSNIQTLQEWANHNGMTIDVNGKGIALAQTISLTNRPVPSNIYPLKDTLIKFVDGLALVYPGNHLTLGNITNKGAYSSITIKIAIDSLSPAAIGLIGDECKGLPMVLNSISLTMPPDELLTGTISIDVLGN